MTGDLDTAAGIAATDRITTTAAYGRVAGTQNTHRMEMRNQSSRLIITFFHIVHKLIELNESFSFSPKLPKMVQKSLFIGQQLSTIDQQFFLKKR